jgi:hypothetical protein
VYGHRGRGRDRGDTGRRDAPRFSWAPVVLALLLCSLPTLSGCTSSSGPGWHIVDTPTQGSSAFFDAVAAISPGDVWAVGGYQTSSASQYLPLAEHWHGSTWTPTFPPSPGTFVNRPLGVAAVSPSDVWAVGASFSLSAGVSNQILIEHWTGTSWSLVPIPNQGAGPNLLNGVAAVPSTSDVWAVGGYYPTVGGLRQALAEHWDGSSWTPVLPPNQGAEVNELTGVAAVSASDVWAVGYYGATGGFFKPLAEHWDGSSWTPMFPPAPGTHDAELTGVAAVSASDVWAVGSYFAADGHKETFIEHWTGSTWTPALLPPNPGVGDNRLTGVAAVSASDVWAVGYYAPSANLTHTFMEHWDGSSWTAVFPPNPIADTSVLNGVAALPSGKVWAVGAFSSTASSPQKTLVLQYP